VKQKLVGFFTKSTIQFQALVLTAEERAAMIAKRNPLGTTIPDASVQIQREIQQEGAELVQLKLAKEKKLLDEITLQLEHMNEQKLDVVAGVFSQDVASMSMKDSICVAIKALKEEALDYTSNKALLEAHTSLLTRQLVLKYYPTLFEELSYNNTANQKN
jgi:hypothetical protein